MKRKVICAIVLIVALLAVLCGCAQNGAACDHCGKKVEWKEWSKSDALPTKSGHWYLKGNVTLSAQQEIPEGEEVVLDLAGHTVSNSGVSRIYHVTAKSSSLDLLDRSASKGGKLVVTGEIAEEGGAVLVTAGTFHMYDITLDASGSRNNANGGAVSVLADGTFHMHSGTVIGATVQTKLDENGFAVGGFGGSVSVLGIMNMDSGVIRDGIANAYVDVVTENETAKINAIYGGIAGNIYAGEESTVNINDGQILNGTADISGGNVYANDYAIIRMSNGSISGGKNVMLNPGGATTDMRTGGGGGNVFICQTSDFWLMGGQIIDGITHGYGGNIRCEGRLNQTGGIVSGGKCYDSTDLEYESKNKNIFFYNGSMNMSGGEVAGFVEVSDFYDSVCSVRLAGTAKIDGGTAGYNLDLPYGFAIVLAELQKGADIHMNVHNGAFTNQTLQSNLQYITLDNTDAEIKCYDNIFYINGKVGCICGLNSKGEHFGDCDGTMKIWGEWTDTENLPINSGYYYLANDIDLIQTALIRGEKQIFVDFNGKTANNGTKNWRIYSLFDTEKSISLTLTDSSAKKNGGLKVHSRLGDQGLAVWCRSAGHSLTLYGGILDASDATARKDGTAICGHSGTSITIHGGKVIGGKNYRYDYTETSGKISILGGSGGAVCAEGEFRMTGGTITSGQAIGKLRDGVMDCGNGGNLYIGPKGSALIEGGTITGGSAYKGGNIACWGELTITGGKITGGKATGAGANIYLFSTRSIKIDEKCVDGGIEEFTVD